MTNLKSKNPHYIRCIKPNAKKASDTFDNDLSLHQVRYLGLLENVRVRRAGFAHRQTYEKWFNRFKVCLFMKKNVICSNKTKHNKTKRYKTLAAQQGDLPRVQGHAQGGCCADLQGAQV